MIPREFFIEDRLERYRLTSSCNLGESGVCNITLGELFQFIDIDQSEFSKISLADSPNRGLLELREEISKLYDDVHPDEVLVTTGTSEALYIFFNLVLSKDSKLSLFMPAFQALYEIPEMLGAKKISISVENRKLDFDLLFKYNPDLVIINHPHNPTGIKIHEDQIANLKTLIQNFDGYTLFDEHYRFLDFENDLSFSGAKLNSKTFVTGSITKCFGLMGLKIGWLVGDKKLLDKARSFKDYLTHTVSPISEYLTLQVLKNRKKIIKPIKEMVQKNIEFFTQNVKHISSIPSFNQPEGGVVCFPKLKDGIQSEQYCDELLKNADVFVLPGSNFEMEGHIRIGFGESEKRFREGIERWMKFEKTIKTIS